MDSTWINYKMHKKLKKMDCLVLELRKEKSSVKVRGDLFSDHRREASVVPASEKLFRPSLKSMYYHQVDLLLRLKRFFCWTCFIWCYEPLNRIHAFWSPFDSGLIFLCEGQHTESKLARSVSTSNQDGWSLSGIDPYGVVRPRQKSQFVRSSIGLKYFFLQSLDAKKQQNAMSVLKLARPGVGPK